MIRLTTLIFIAGLLHFAILAASFSVPQVLNWRQELGKLSPLLRQLVWIYGGYVVLMIVGFGAISTLLPGQLAAGDSLARALSALIAVFWAVRLVLQLAVLDATPYLDRWYWRLGYHALTAVFIYHTCVYTLAATVPHWLAS